MKNKIQLWHLIIIIGGFATSFMIYSLLLTSTNLTCGETNQVLKDMCNQLSLQVKIFLIISIIILIGVTFAFVKETREYYKHDEELFKP